MGVQFINMNTKELLEILKNTNPTTRIEVISVDENTSHSIILHKIEFDEDDGQDTLKLWIR